MNTDNTAKKFDEILARGREIFRNKFDDYGGSWLAFRLPSLTDQMLIKAKRIRRLELLQGKGKIPEGVTPEYIGIINYALMALIKMDSNLDDDEVTVDIDAQQLLDAYDSQAGEVKKLMLAKNHDYGEAWRDMRVSSITDQILVKLLRLKKMEDTGGPKYSEPPKSHYQDIINYCIFALILLEK